jgi:hypothetical protein
LHDSSGGSVLCGVRLMAQKDNKKGCSDEHPS